MARYNPAAVLPGGQPGPWGDPVSIRYDTRDVLLYAVGIGLEDLRGLLTAMEKRIFERP